MQTKPFVNAFLLFGCVLAISACDAAGNGREGGPPDGQPFEIPQEAYSACASLNENASCSMTGRNNETLAGTCVTPPPETDNQALSCRPQRMGNDGNRPPPPNSN